MLISLNTVSRYDVCQQSSSYAMTFNETFVFCYVLEGVLLNICDSCLMKINLVDTLSGKLHQTLELVRLAPAYFASLEKLEKHRLLV